MSNDLNLRVVARVEDPSAELFDYLAIKEGVESPLECWVDLAVPRNFEWSDEIGEKTVEFGIADIEGNILATFETLQQAEAAKGRARVNLSLSFEEEVKEKVKAGKPGAKPAAVSQILSNEGHSEAAEPTTVEEALGIS